MLLQGLGEEATGGKVAEDRMMDEKCAFTVYYYLILKGGEIFVFKRK